MKILTIVVPSYNTEVYINECLPTMISKCSIDDIELLLINDGSTDNTQYKLEQYESRYPQSIHVLNKENGGHGSVINYGINEAKGKYFKVIDGDDWTLTEGLDNLVKLLKSVDADLILNPYIKHNIETGKEDVIGQAGIEKNKKLSFDRVVGKLPLLAMHGITYKTDLLRKNGIHFQEQCFYDDAEYYIYPVAHIKSMIYLEFPVYVYRVGSPTQSVNPTNAIRNKDMLGLIIENLIQFYNSLPADIPNDRKKYITKQICHIIQNMYGIYLKMPIGREAFNGIQQFDKKIKRQSIELYNASGNFAIKALRLNLYLVYVFGCKLFEIERKRRGY